MDSIRIYDRSHWFRWSRQHEKGNNGGSQIDFLRVFAGMEVKEAVFWLLDFAGYRRNEELAKPKVRLLPRPEKKAEKRRGFILPPYAGSNVNIIHYLENERGISRAVIDYFIRKGDLYESRPYHNAVFVGKDSTGRPRFASMRGIYDRQGRPFKCEVAGNDKHYGFCDRVDGSERIVVFEAAIDLMSYQTLFPDDRANMVALGMLSDAPLETLLHERPEIRSIMFCLDNDGPGRKAADELMEKYYGRGYEVEDYPAAPGYKDFNEWLTEGILKMDRGRDVLIPSGPYTRC